MNSSPREASRRSFLQRFAGTVTLSSALPLQAVAVQGDLYVNHRVGLAFRRPAGWRYEHLRTFADIRNEYEYATPDPELAEALRTGPLPLVAVSQHAVLNALAASATVYAEQNPLRPGESLFEAAPDIVRAVGSLLRDVRILASPRFGSVAHWPAMEWLYGFFYEDRLGNRGPVRHRTLVVLSPPQLFTFHMLDIPADGIDAQAHFDALRDSIELA